MNYKRLIGIILTLIIATVVSCSSITQKPVETAKPEGVPITVKGKLGYMKALGGYFVRSEIPAGEFIIVNHDDKLLEDLFKSGKEVTIEGRFPMGAEHLFIEKIDGQPYTGKQ